MFIDTVSEDAATGEVADYFAQQRAAWGFLPNYASCFGTRPDVARAWGALNTAVRDGMDRRRFEIATIGAARALRSSYCTAAHSKFLRDVCGDEQAAVAANTDPDALGEVDRAVFDFAALVATDAAGVRQEDVDTLKQVGLSDADVADVVFAASARAFFTKVLDALGSQLDAETAATFEPDLRAAMIVGRPAAD